MWPDRGLPLVSGAYPQAGYRARVVQLGNPSPIQIPLGDRVLLSVAIEVEIIVVQYEVVRIDWIGGGNLQLSRYRRGVADCHRVEHHGVAVFSAVGRGDLDLPLLPPSQPAVRDIVHVVNRGHLQTVTPPLDLSALLRVAVGVVEVVGNGQAGRLGRARRDVGDVVDDRRGIHRRVGLGQSPRPMAPCVTRVLAVAVGVKHGDGEINVAGACSWGDPVCGPRAGGIAAVGQLAVRELHVGTQVRPTPRAHVEVESSVAGDMGAAVPLQGVGRTWGVATRAEGESVYGRRKTPRIRMAGAAADRPAGHARGLGVGRMRERD